MHTEVEAKFLDANHDAVRLRLKQLGGVLEQPMRLMRRTILDYPDERLQKNSSYIRVRDEGDKVTLTFKKFDSLSVDGAKELTIAVNDYEETIKIFEAIGLRISSQQESKRETWRLGKCEIVLDEWPWLKPYIEIEANDESQIREMANQLGFDWSKAVFGDVTVAYIAEFDVSMEKIAKHPKIVFSKQAPEWLARTRRY